MDIQLKSEVLVSGTITSISRLIPIPRPKITFSMESYRSNKKGEWHADNLSVVVFDDEEFAKKYKVGDRVRIEGELQSRNYSNQNFTVGRVYSAAVQHYMEIFGEVPALKEYIKKGQTEKLSLIDWDKLLKKKLIPDVPEDSMYRANGVKKKTPDTFAYCMDQSGGVYKNKEHTSYEIISTKIIRLEQERSPKENDLNRITLQGQLNHAPRIYKKEWKSAKIEVKFHNLLGNISYWHAFAGGTWVDYIEKNLQKETYVRLTGRIQSRTYMKETEVSWRKENGRKMKKVLDNEYYVREISISRIERLLN